MNSRSESTRLVVLLSAVVALASGCDQRAPKPPETSAPAASPASAAPSAAAAPVAAAASAAAAPASASASAPAAAGKTIKEKLGAITKVEVSGKAKLELTKQSDVDALLSAIGTDQIPSGVLRRCPDDIVMAMKDASGKTKGSVGLCVSDGLWPEFFTGDDDRKGITLADEATVRKLLKLEAAKAKPAPSAAPKK